MKLFLSIILTSLFAATVATAEDSSTVREAKSWMVTFQPAGYGPNAFYSNGLNAGLFLDPQSLILIETTFSNNARPLFSWNYDNYKVNAYSVGVHYKQFVSNSFYFKAGVDHRVIDFKYESSSTTSFTKFKGNSTGVSISIGNQWLFNRFTLGCDWVGFFSPLAYGTSDESFGGNYNKSDLDSDIKRYVQSSQIMFTRVYIGFAF